MPAGNGIDLRKKQVYSLDKIKSSQSFSEIFEVSAIISEVFIYAIDVWSFIRSDPFFHKYH